MKLRSTKIRKYFAGGLLFTTYYQFCSPAMLSQCGEGWCEEVPQGDVANNPSDAGSLEGGGWHGDDQMTVQAIWDWDQAVALLPDL
jgi:hypothetical protein